MLNRDQYRQMLLAGSVTFPATFPQVGRLALCSEPRPGRPEEQLEMLSVDEFPSPRVTLTRRVLVSSVRAVFLPRDAHAVDFSEGEWLLEDEIACGLKHRLSNCDGPLYGIAFVPESEPSMLHVSAGMTAAESSQYYPPLPGDPSHNHYNPWPIHGVLPAGPRLACSSADDATIFMQACSSMDVWWESQRARAMPMRFSDLQPLAATHSSEPLLHSCTVSHVGLPMQAAREPQSRAALCAATYPFPTDDL